jgi:hypothetical protein
MKRLLPIFLLLPLSGCSGLLDPCNSDWEKGTASCRKQVELEAAMEIALDYQKADVLIYKCDFDEPCEYKIFVGGQ